MTNEETLALFRETAPTAAAVIYDAETASIFFHLSEVEGVRLLKPIVIRVPWAVMGETVLPEFMRRSLQELQKMATANALLRSGVAGPAITGKLGS